MKNKNNGNNQRIVEKARQYQDSSYYDYVMYFFSKKHLMDKYIEVIGEALGEQNLSHFMFFLDENMTTWPTDLKTIEGYFKSRKVKLVDLFQQLNSC